MGRTKKEHISLNIKLDRIIGEALDRKSLETGKSKTAIVEEALTSYLRLRRQADTNKQSTKELVDKLLNGDK